MSAVDTDYIRNLHPDWEVVTALCDEVDKLRAETIEAADALSPAMGATVGGRGVAISAKHLAAVHARLAAALTELAHHGDLTPAGKRKLQQILGDNGSQK